jgi:hypothetical protein
MSEEKQGEHAPIRGTWHARLKKALKGLIESHGAPHEIAMGFALGIFIGMSPTFGFQMALGVFLAAFLKWSKLGALLGVQITNVFTAPLVYPVVYWVGAKIMGRGKIADLHGFNLDSVFVLLKKAPIILFDLTVGGIALGLPLAILSYWLVLRAVIKYRTKIKPKIDDFREHHPLRQKKKK